MSIPIDKDEAITAQCIIQEFTCILTSTRLIVVAPTEEESYPLKEIAAIGVYEDIERNNRNLKQAQIRRALLGAGCGFLYGAALGLPILREQPIIGLILWATFLLMGIPISLIMPLREVKEAILSVVFRQAPTKQYRFKEMDRNEHLVKTFADRVFAQVSNPSRKTFALN